MLLTTTDTLDGKTITAFHGIVIGDAFVVASLIRDMMGSSSAYGKELTKARATALEQLSEGARAAGANAVIGITLQYETPGKGQALLITVTGTAVTAE